MKVGLTGGIGCGKSTVAGFFAAAGWKTLDSDQIVAGLLAQDEHVRGELRQRWGDGVFTAEGEVDRRAVGRRVFQQAEELRWLEGLLHPLVRERWQAAVRNDSQVNWLVEIPLIFEKRLESAFDLTVCVASPSDVVEVRMAERGYSVEEVERRRQQQMPLDEKMRLADFVITNAGSLEFLKDQTTRLITQISGN